MSPMGTWSAGSIDALRPHRRPATGEGETAQERLIGPLRHVYGISDKILTMTLSGLLLGASDGHPSWFAIGKDMIAIDTLVHNFLHRSGILENCGAQHGYGVGCYAKGGCADIIHAIAAQIDARAFNANFPSIFPRFVQHAIWRWSMAILSSTDLHDLIACHQAYRQRGNNWPTAVVDARTHRNSMIAEQLDPSMLDVVRFC
jgi:hypothetical protein